VTSLRFRLPGRVQPLGAWLASLLPAVDRIHRRRLIEEGCVRLDGRSVDRAGLDCPPGAVLEIEGTSELLCGFDSVPTDPKSDPRAHRDWQAIVDLPAWRSGAIEVVPGRELEFHRAEVRGALACLVLSGEPSHAPEICEALARASMPVVGDLLRGGLGVPGGPRLATVEAISKGSALDWPDEEVWRIEAEDHRARGDRAEVERESGAGELVVSRETGRALQSGHPWILPDDASEPATRYRPGALVRVVERGDGPVGWAHVEATPRLAARLWAAGDLSRREIPSVEARVARAIARRRALLVDLANSGTNAFRLIHGEGDGLPGLFIDRLGPLLLRTQLPTTPEGAPWSVLEVLHLRRPGTSRVDRVRWVEGGIESLEEAGFAVTRDSFFVEERGLRLSVDPGWDAPRRPRPGYGLFVDQRDNRARLAAHATAGGRWLNLFAHTGAFSVSLLAAGAEQVESVDLSAAYLERLEGNLAANVDRGVEPSRHRTVRGDVRRFLSELEPSERFRGIVVDPPTAAAAGRRFWSVKQDLEPLLRLAIDRLEEGGVLLVTQNRAGPPLGLDRVIERILERANRGISTLEAVPAGLDHPSLKGFPEGDPFEGWLVTLR